MPPIRTTSITKQQKTERTHEENQERAYIAASRRSDRSLEARIESARRASEIHKKRTGRALRVTEQDVINEEMYEEEDDLPASYRRFAQHLQHNHLSLDGKFESYMIANLATRQAMLNQYWSSRGIDDPNPPQKYPIMIQNAPMSGQAFSRQSMSPQYANPPHFAYQNMPPSTASTVQTKQKAQSSYPLQGNQFVPQRSASISTSPSSVYPANLQAINPTSSEEGRRMSLPAQPFQNTFLTTPMNEATQQSADQIPFNLQPSVLNSVTPGMNFGPLSVILPLDQQQIVGCALSPTNPSTQFLMAGNEAMQPLWYNSDPSGPAKSAEINQTLASNPPDMVPSTEANPTFTTLYSPQSTNTEEYLQSPAWPPNQLSFDFNDDVADFKSLDVNHCFNTTTTSDTQTPNNFDFSSYINIIGPGE